MTWADACLHAVAPAVAGLIVGHIPTDVERSQHASTPGFVLHSLSSF